MPSLCFCFAWAFLISARASNDSVRLYMFTPLCIGTESTCGWPAGKAMDVGAQIMIHHINEGRFLRGNATLEVNVIDTHCDPKYVPEAVAKVTQLDRDKWPFGIIGGGCSGVTRSLAPFFKTYRIPLISHTASAADLSDRQRFPSFFRMYPPDSAVIQAWFYTCSLLKWTTFAVVYDVDYGESFVDFVLGLMESYRGELVDVMHGKSTAIVRDTSAAAALALATEIVATRVRAILAIMYAPTLCSIVCQLVSFGMKGAYLFHLGWLAEGWQYDFLTSNTCSDNEMNTATDFAIFFNAPTYNYDMSGIAKCSLPGFSIRDFANENEQRRNNLNAEYLSHSSYAADAVCMMAVLYNQMVDFTGSSQDLIQMDESTYQVFNSKAQSVDFLGISGRVSFPSNSLAYGAGDRLTPLTVYQKIRGSNRVLGIYNNRSIRFNRNVDGSNSAFQFDANYTMTHPPEALFPTCPLGSVFSFQKRRCQGCSASSIFVQLTGRCECRPGYYRNDQTCYACGLGVFSDIIGSTACEFCARGSHTTQKGSSACVACPAGKFGNATYGGGCISCETVLRGSKSPKASLSADACICPKGTFQTTHTHGACHDCGFLKTTADEGETSLEDCHFRLEFYLMIFASISGLIIICLAGLGIRMYRNRFRRIMHEQNCQKVLQCILNSRDLLFPVAIMPFDKFKYLGQLVSYEEAHHKQLLVFLHSVEEIDAFKKSHKIIFGSHQWLGWEEPDPNGVHYEALVQGFNAMISDLGWNSIAQNIYVWVDYHSVPQENKDLQAMAIRTLPFYASQATTFIILAPDTYHFNTQAPCNFKTYQKRMWCRAELFSFYLNRGLKDLYKAEETSCGIQMAAVQEAEIDDTIFVFEGDCTCCTTCHRNTHSCDKEVLRDVFLGIYADVLCSRADAKSRLTLYGSSGRSPTTFYESGGRSPATLHSSEKAIIYGAGRISKMGDCSQVDSIIDHISNQKDRIFPKTFKAVFEFENKYPASTAVFSKQNTSTAVFSKQNSLASKQNSLASSMSKSNQDTHSTHVLFGDLIWTLEDMIVNSPEEVAKIVDRSLCVQQSRAKERQINALEESLQKFVYL